MSGLTPEQKSEIEAATERALKKMLLTLGINATDAIETQADFAHLRKQRLASEQIGKLAVKTVIGMLLTGACSALLIGLKSIFTH